MTRSDLRMRDLELRAMARYFHALKDIMRLRILVALASEGEMTVTALARTLGISQPLVSFHLRPLRQLGVVDVRRVGRVVFCSVDLPEILDRQGELADLLSTVAERS